MGDAYNLADEVAAALERGATVLTGNQRAARILRRAIDRWNRDAGMLRWTPPAVLPWSAWTASLWRQLLLDGAAGHLLLNRTQEHALWRSVIAADESLATLRSSESLAQLAAEAWAVLARYRGLGRLQGSETNGDTRSFARWAAEFEERCRANEYLPDPRLEAILRREVLAGTLEAPRELVLVGFDRLLPAQSALIEAFRTKGSRIELPADWPLPARRGLFEAEDEESEIRAAALWAREYLQRSPGALLGIVVPGLEEQRAQIDRIFRAVLAPERQNIAHNGTGTYEFSSGVPLASIPMVTCALDLLAWVSGTGTMPRQKLSDLLLSAYFGAPGEETARAEFDALELRRAEMLRPEVSLQWLTGKIAQSRRKERLRHLTAVLRSMQQAATRRVVAGERRPHSEWAEAMREILQAAQWATQPGESSVEFQTRQRWESTLDELTTLDFDGMRVTCEEALASLRRIAQEAIFAPESRDAPVQILGPEESSGQQFDAIWFLRAADMTWPPPVSGNPLIGWPLRRELGLPGSSAAADAAQAVRVTRRVASGASEAVVFSYAKRSADGEQRPSVTLAGLGLAPFDAPFATENNEEEPALEIFEDRSPIPPLPDRVFPGGASVLKAQAACAFRAFSEFRLFSTALEEREPGLNARERGTAVHKMLEEFWDEVKTQAALRAMPTHARIEVLSRCIDRALNKSAREQATAWEGAYLETQRTRLMRLGLAWLEMEAGRTVPFTVVQQETASEATIGPLRLSLRVDRVDEVTNGSVLIDYKTGDVNSAAWSTDRPDEPQLPLYAALAGDLRLDAIVFGKVRPGKYMELTGYEETLGTLTKTPPRQPASLEAQVEEWRGVLTLLAEDFASGDRRVSPKTYPETCEFCAQRLLCRLDIAARALEEEDDEEDEREDIFE